MTATRFAFILCAPNDLRFSGFGQHAQNSSIQGSGPNSAASALLREAAARRSRPAGGRRDPREVIDDSLVKSMEESGFIAHLRKTYAVPAQ